MFFSKRRRQKQIEKDALRELRKRVYQLVITINDDYLNYGAENNIPIEDLSDRSPWTDDLKIVLEMQKQVERMDTNGFIQKYGLALEELENRHLL